MDNAFEVFNNTKENIKELVIVEDLVSFALDYLNINKSILNVIIVDDDAIQKINKEYRGIDKVTDVISFDLEDDKTFKETDFRVLGDIYICLNKVKSQALEYGHSFLREICFLSIHGLLHLLGYDHMNKEDEKEMFQLQELILNEYGIER